MAKRLMLLMFKMSASSIHRRPLHKGDSRICPFCRVKYTLLIGKQIFCSKACRLSFLKEHKNGRKRFKKSCLNCGKEFETGFSRHVLCSSECRKKNREMTNSAGVASLREYVFERDDFICFQCKNRFQYLIDLHAHHYIPLYKGGRDSVENIVTVCKPCHMKIHKVE